MPCLQSLHPGVWPVPPEPIETIESLPAAEMPGFIPVVRFGRYTLVELVPTAAQRDLLLQTIDVAMPEDARATEAVQTFPLSPAASGRQP